MPKMKRKSNKVKTKEREKNYLKNKVDVKIPNEKCNVNKESNMDIKY